jgi:DNA-directed RNA polymerase subunit D
MAIETVEFTKNSSVLYDEIIAHRLGMIPLTTDLKTYNLATNCKCEGEGCARCSLQLSLSSKNPGTVMAGEMESKDPKIIPAYPQTPIVKLLKGQELEFIATAQLGNGQLHTKWVPGNVWYSYKPIITINNKSKKIDEFREKYPAQIFNDKGNIDKNKLTDPALIDACFGICDDIIKIEYDNTAFVMYVESYGQLSCAEMVIKAAELLGEQVTEFSEAL